MISSRLTLALASVVLVYMMIWYIKYLNKYGCLSYSTDNLICIYDLTSNDYYITLGWIIISLDILKKHLGEPQRTCEGVSHVQGLGNQICNIHACAVFKSDHALG